VTLDIIDPGTGDTIRTYSSTDPVEPPLAGRNIPDYWIRPAPRLGTTAGLHRFVWDLRYAPPPSDRRGYPIAAVAANTPVTPRGLLVLPGTYQARLTVDRRVYRQPIVIRMDPRVKTPAADLMLQFTLSKDVDVAMRRLTAARATLTKRVTEGSGDGALQAQLRAVTDALQPLQGLFESLQEADAKPTAALEAAVKEALARATAALGAITSHEGAKDHEATKTTS
jgi:hypothetical protein